MGKKGSWISAIKRVFTHGSKEKHAKPADGSSEKRPVREKRSGKGILRRGDTKSFIPLFREPSSIEKILGEADQLLLRPPASSEPPKIGLPGASISPLVASPQRDSPGVRSPRAPRPVSPKIPSPKAVSPKIASPIAISPKASTSRAASSKTVATPPKVGKGKKGITYVKRPEPSLREQQVSATKIQAAFRGYLARRSFRAVRGLVRLQGVVKGQSVKRQTINAMKQLQLLVRVQTQIQSRRIQMLESQRRHDKEAESTVSKWTANLLSEAGQNEDWDDSTLTKDEADARLRKKVEAVIKRERAMAYAYSHQLWKANPTSTQTPVDIRANGYPWWWNWLDRQLPQEGTSRGQPAGKIVASTPPRSISGYKPSPRSHKPGSFTPDNHHHDLPGTPQSSRSVIPTTRVKQFHTPSRTPPRPGNGNSSTKPRPIYDAPMKDDDSLMSCPPFLAVPSYMAQTASAKAKVRASSNPKDRLFAGTVTGTGTGTAGNESKRRFSFPLTPNTIGSSFKWNRGSKETSSQADKQSVGGMSVDSTASMPAALMGRRKPFNRFV
ncbi:protein IQ-DOMAIN 13 [Andrographis paniculata]|uniref:protein IQ-DOMAIN 13 n=1 Tax=Andrographis paniculata TaxID=175694 RepID=UPI0021E927EF|nr:protein IQ-DOMAIN 13 [Andrographis paniculata]XP_051118336.1 protein IQ-DOMAIN 13 [Andrographis paniculata]XP_051118338.1 protein IQ-DOMAIN 13 [Andrographis paniculata]XP_051118339.1 protein IQ-DOMAIN 13 [Andrographis paniculata]XP_051118340.1 protein IQ-DOMAIN 13 [Andrographis paniculata]